MRRTAATISQLDDRLLLYFDWQEAAMINRRLGMSLVTAALFVLLLSLPARLITAEEPSLRPAAIGSVYRTPVDAMPPLMGEVYVKAIRQ